MKQVKPIIALLLFALPFLAHAEERVYITSQEITVLMSMTDPSGVSEMQFSVDGGITWSQPEPYATTKNLTLPDLAEGEHCIYGKFRDGAGNWTESLEACAWVDTTPPGGMPEIDGFKITVEVSFGANN